MAELGWLADVLGFANLMSTAPELAGEIDTCEYLFLRELSEPKENSLRLLVEEAKPDVLTVPITAGEVEFGQGRPVHSTEACRLFEIFWDSYVAYSVRNELYAKNTESEIVSWGRRLRLYSKSHFLEYISSATFASPQYPGLMEHIEVTCENHVIDVVSSSSPTIRRLRPLETLQ